MRPSRALITFSFVAEHFEQSGSPIQGLMPLFAPVAANNAAQPFDPDEFSAEVESRYGLAMHPYVAEQLIPHMVAADLLIETERHTNHASYSYHHDPQHSYDPSAMEDRVESVLDDCEVFIRAVTHPSSELIYSRDDIASSLFRALKDMEFAHIFHRPDRSKFTSRMLSLRNSNNDSHGTEAEPNDTTENTDNPSSFRLDYLTARFVIDCVENRPTTFEYLAEVSAGALLSEVVLDFQSPEFTFPPETPLTVLVDGPLLMDALGLATDRHRQYASRLLEQLRAIGCQVYAFQSAVDEMYHAIKATLHEATSPGGAHGPLGRLLRTSPSVRPYAQSLMQRPRESIEQDLSIPILEYTEIMRARGYRYLTDANEKKLYGAIGFYRNEKARARDAQAIADVIRLRGALRDLSRDIFHSGYVFVSRNTRLARRSHQFLVDEGLASIDYPRPCITDRELAGLVWIASGGAGEDLPESKLVAGCAAALVPRRDVITRAVSFLEDTDDQRARHFETLMTRERTATFFMDMVAGDHTLITSDNIHELVDAVEREVAEKYYEQYESEKSELAGQVVEQSGEIDQLHGRASEAESERDRRLSALTDEATAAGRRWYRGVLYAGYCILAITAVAVFLVPSPLELGSGTTDASRVSVLVLAPIALVLILLDRFSDGFTVKRLARAAGQRAALRKAADLDVVELYTLPDDLSH